MKFMLILKNDETATPATPPTPDEISEMVTAMGRYNEELIAAGILLAGEGLRESALGAIIDYEGDSQTVTDGPFTEAKELVSGFWIIQASSRDEAVAWARKIPLTEGRVEVRQVVDISEFDQEHEYVKKEHEWREERGESRTA